MSLLKISKAARTFPTKLTNNINTTYPLFFTAKHLNEPAYFYQTNHNIWLFLNEYLFQRIWKSHQSKLLTQCAQNFVPYLRYELHADNKSSWCVTAKIIESWCVFFGILLCLEALALKSKCTSQCLSENLMKSILCVEVQRESYL